MRQLDLFGVPGEKSVDKKQEEVSVKNIEAEIVVEEKIFKNMEEVVFENTEMKVEVAAKTIHPKKNFKEKKAQQKTKRGRKSFKEMDAEVDLINIPADEILFQKQYYAIGEVAEWFNVNASLLRLWENEFKILKPRKTRKGDRLFRPEDVKNIELIYHLLRQRKFSMEGAKQYLEANKQHAETNKILIQSLTKFRNFLSELKTNLGE